MILKRNSQLKIKALAGYFYSQCGDKERRIEHLSAILAIVMEIFAK